ncbi:MAG TPA: MotB family protein [Methylocella sp.]|nr:MotB family protein [Methylocella sp.]
MANPEHREIFIIKRHYSHDEGHHGGAWKIAFADFMTAMMALFLVLWLISSTSEKTKHTVAQYFNPVKLVDMTTLRKGFRDPKETEMGEGPNIKESPQESDQSQHNPSAKAKDDVNCQAGSNASAQTEAALFRDPYAVLAEIAASAPGTGSKSPSGAASGRPPADAQGTFSDPFATTPQDQEKPPEGLLPLAQGKDAQGKDAQDMDAQAKVAQAKDAKVRAAVDALKPQATADNAVPSQASSEQANLKPEEDSRAARSLEASRSATAAAAQLKSAIVNAIANNSHMPDLPHIEVQVTPEGILISLTDDANYSMFAIGSAKPKPETVQIMEKIGQILKAGSGSIVIRGHTDGRPYRSAIYDNWRLSSARAHMALYMLTRGGLSEKRIENVEGYADHHLKFPNNPNASENRRIEILLRKESP